MEDAIIGRRSVRNFLPEDVAQEDILKMISLATRAPSAGNRRMWHFVVIKNRSLKQKMRDIVVAEIERLAQVNGVDPGTLQGSIFNATLFVDAPVAIAVLTEPYRSRIDELLLGAGLGEAEVDRLRCRPDLQSISAAIQNLMLAAHEMGYGTCWMVGPMVARPALEQLLEVKAPRSLAAIIALGKPERPVAPRSPRDPAEVTTFID